MTQKLFFGSCYTRASFQVIYLYLLSLGSRSFGGRAGLRNVALCGNHASDAQTYGDMRTWLVLKQPSAEITCGGMRICLGRGLCGRLRHPFAQDRDRASKRLKLFFYFRCNPCAHNAGQTAKPVLKLPFYNIKCKC